MSGLKTENEHRSNYDDILIVNVDDLIKDLPEVIVDAHGKKHTICENDFIGAWNRRMTDEVHS